MTIKEFLDAYTNENKVIGVNCETDAEVEELSKMLDDAGARWRTGNRYTKKKEDAPVIYYNDGMYSSLSYARQYFGKGLELLSLKSFIGCPFCGSPDVVPFNEERYCLCCGAYSLDGKSWQKKEVEYDT